LGKYILERRIGAGGMGEVWAAHDPDLDRRVALKVLRPALAGNDDARARLQREGRAMARLRHPNVITVFEAVFSEGRGAIAMELIDGKSLADWLATKPRPNAIVDALLAAGRGLAAAHAAGMVHRDFKPHNVLVDRDGRIVVTDFGLARASETASSSIDPVDSLGGGDGEPSVAQAAADALSAREAAMMATAVDETAAASTATPALDETAAATPSPVTGRTPSWSEAGALHSPLTRTGELLGTPAYMAPEQLAGGEADARSDQFAFCVTAWEALTGKRPFRGGSMAELVASVTGGSPSGGDALPARLRPILTRGLSRSPGDRFRSITALLRAIERAWKRPRRVAIAAGAVGVLAAAVFGVVMVSGSDPVAKPCTDPDTMVGRAWSPAIKARFVERGHGGRLLGFFDKWRERWIAADREVCSKPEHSEFPDRRRCLDTLRDDAVAMVAAVERVAPATMARTEIMFWFPPPDLCQTNPRGIIPITNDASTRLMSPEAIALRVDMIEMHHALLSGKPVDFASLVERAKLIGSGTLIAEALLRHAIALDEAATTDAEQAAACSFYDKAGEEAERAGHGRNRLYAMIESLLCGVELGMSADDLIARADLLDNAADGLGDPLIRAFADSRVLWQIDRDRGRWSRAIDRLARAEQVWRQHSLNLLLRARVSQAELRVMRHAGDDLEVALSLLQGFVPDHASALEVIARRLGPLLWMTGDFTGAEPFHVSAAVTQAQARGAAHVDVAVMVGVEGAEVIAAIAPNLDPTRLSMREYDGAVAAGKTDASGRLALRAPVGGVIVARTATGSIGAAPVPDAGGDVVVRLHRGAVVSGTVTGFSARTDDDDPPVARAARRQVPTIYATTFVGDRPITWHVPVAVADGAWRFENAIHGRYTISADVTSALDDDQTVQAQVEIGDSDPPPIALALPDPQVATIAIRPAVAGRVVIVPAAAGEPLPQTWDAIASRLRLAPAFSMADITAPLRRDQLIPGAQVGDAVIVMSALGRTPFVVCMLPGARSRFDDALFRFRPGPDRTPPVCRELAAPGDAVVVLER
jgi:serine/threonine protein kinase